MEKVRTYYFDEPIETPVYDISRLVKALHNIQDILIRNVVSVEDFQEYLHEAETIENTYDYINARLQHSEMERFNR